MNTEPMNGDSWMSESTVLLTISGDTNTTEVQADTTVPLGDLVPSWAAVCSSHPPEDLVAVSGDHTALFDPGVTLAELGLGYGAVIRLVTGEEAMGILDVQTVEVMPDPAAAAAATPAAVPVLAVAALVPTAAGSTNGHAPTSTPPEPVWHQQTWSPPSETAPAYPPVASPPAFLPPPLPPGGAHWSGAPPEWEPYPPSTPAEIDPPPPGQVSADPTAGSHPEDTSLPVKVGGGERFWKAIKAALKAKAAPAPPAGAFAKAVPPKAAARYRQALAATDRSHNLEGMIRTAPLGHCMVIAVVSPKGGPGKTTITALLGMLLAELRRDPVLALDANPDLGDLKDKLSDESAPAALVDDLASWLNEHPGATPAELSARLGVGPHGLRFIPTPRPPAATKERMIAAADFALYRQLIARLRDYAGIVLVDCGTGLLDPPVRAALEAADQIVLVTDSSATTARQVVAAAGLLPPGTPTWLVANKMPQKGSMLDLDQVTAAMPYINGVTVIPMPSGGHLAENVVTPHFTWSTAPVAWREPVRELAARLANNWGTLD
jgi:MinD-like ATPase involved in chromosome partitioning or flagellar assembly